MTARRTASWPRYNGHIHSNRHDGRTPCEQPSHTPKSTGSEPVSKTPCKTGCFSTPYGIRTRATGVKATPGAKGSRRNSRLSRGIASSVVAGNEPCCSRGATRSATRLDVSNVSNESEAGAVGRMRPAMSPRPANRHRNRTQRIRCRLGMRVPVHIHFVGSTSTISSARRERYTVAVIARFERLPVIASRHTFRQGQLQLPSVTTRIDELAEVKRTMPVRKDRGACVFKMTCPRELRTTKCEFHSTATTYTVNYDTSLGSGAAPTLVAHHDPEVGTLIANVIDKHRSLDARVVSILILEELNAGSPDKRSKRYGERCPYAGDCDDQLRAHALAPANSSACSSTSSTARSSRSGG